MELGVHSWCLLRQTPRRARDRPPSPNSTFTHVVLLSGRLCPRGPETPFSHTQSHCTFTDHCPRGEGRTFSPDGGDQSHPSQPALPSQDLAQTLGGQVRAVLQ